MAQPILSIVTPTYNRKELLKRVYDCLCKQTDYSFEWIIVDDGSDDGTEDFFSDNRSNGFDVFYFKKDNGGKHSALNYSLNIIRGEITLILDSDDTLVPEAVEYIVEDWKHYKNDESICCLSYCRILPDGEFISNADSDLYVYSDHISYRINEKRGGDRCEVVRSEYLKELPFPIYPEEKFMSEGWLWTHLAYKYKTVYINKGIYICEYLENGLTKSGRVLRLKSPKGMMDNCKAYFIKRVALSIRIKEYLLFWVYGKCAGESNVEIIKAGHDMVWLTICCLPGYILYKLWEKKYLK